MKLFLHEKVWRQKFSKNKSGALKITRIFKYKVWRRKVNYLLNKSAPLWLGFPRENSNPARGYPIYDKSTQQIKINPFDRERKPRESPQLINKKWFFVINNDVQVVPDLSDNSSIRIRSIDKNARLITFFRTSKSYLSSWIP